MSATMVGGENLGPGGPSKNWYNELGIKLQMLIDDLAIFFISARTLVVLAVVG